MAAENNPPEEPIGLKVRAEKIVAVELPKIDCNLMDARSRKIMVYLIEKELKTMKSFPKQWVESTILELEGIKKGLELCTQIRKRKEEENAAEGQGSSGQSGEPTGET